MGLQVLLTSSDEGQRAGLPGHLLLAQWRRFGMGLKVLHMGWNLVRFVHDHPLFAGIPDNSHFYFVHSYYADPEDRAIVAGETDYGHPFASVVIRDNVMATQFHPEKSAQDGLPAVPQLQPHRPRWPPGDGPRYRRRRRSPLRQGMSH